MIRVLVADDQLAHIKQGYQFLFDEREDFEAFYPRSWSEFLRLLSDEYFDLYVVDVDLTNWNIELDDLLRRLPKGSLVWLASVGWQQGDTHKMLTRALQRAHGSGLAFVGTVDLRLLERLVDADASGLSSSLFGTGPEKGYAENTVKLMQVAVETYGRRSNYSLGGDETVRILHISDMQYGDPNSDRWAKHALELIQIHVCEELNKEVHFLAVTGDITYSGKNEQFDQAYAELVHFAGKLWPGDEGYRERIWITPGNHDVNMPLCAAAESAYSFSEKEISRTSGVNKELLNYGLSPYRRFVARLLKENSNDDFSSGNGVSDRFHSLGLRIHFLNSAGSISCRTPKASSVDQDSLHQADTTVEKNLFNLALCHHGGPRQDFTENFKRGDSVEQVEAIDNWQDVAAHFELHQVRLLLHGHDHSWRSRALDYRGKQRPDASAYFELNRGEFVEACAATTHLNSALRGTNPRGFNLIELSRTSSKVTGLTVSSYEVESGGPRRCSSTEYRL